MRFGVAAASALALVGGGVAMNARAADGPTTQELLDQCGQIDYCAFHPQQEWTTLADETQVSSSYWNCTDLEQQASVSWSDTKGQSNSVQVAVSVEASFFKVLSAAVETTYGHTWEFSHTWSETATANISPGTVAWITRGAPMRNVMGQYEYHFSSRYYGHYYWYTDGFVETGPDPDGTAQIAFHQRLMTDEEKSVHCASSNPNDTGGGSATVVTTNDLVPSGSGQQDTVLSTGKTSGTPFTGTISITSSDPA